MVVHLYPDAVWATGLGAAIAVGCTGGVISTLLGAGILSIGGGSAYFATIAIAMAATFAALASLSRHVPLSADL